VERGGEGGDEQDGSDESEQGKTRFVDGAADVLASSGLHYSERLNGGYWSVTSRTAYAETRNDQRCTPTT
jgi:hypothetical protein